MKKIILNSICLLGIVLAEQKEREEQKGWRSDTIKS